MTPETWFEQLSDALEEAGAVPGVRSGVTDEERDALLELARVAAHTSERWTAPISTFLAGAVLHGLPAQERAAAIRRLVSDLEPAS